ncbi:MAG TPA: NAD(P)H-dependent oxidoreductase [Rhizomicrobium sp.]|nr:NAD(P)H-dependent oxidoreductase [Rhizomicrobium sp.]
MKHAVILAHPNPKSFNATIANAYVKAAVAHGHEARLRDLYAMDFDPRLKASEIPGPKGFAPAKDVAAERKFLSLADVFVFVYPFWINAAPAILKGYMERVFGMGFAYRPGKGGIEPMLTGKKMISFTSSGAPIEWVKKTGAWDAARKLFDEHASLITGLTVVDHIHFGNVIPGMRADVVERCVAKVDEAVAKYF